MKYKDRIRYYDGRFDIQIENGQSLKEGDGQKQTYDNYRSKNRG